MTNPEDLSCKEKGDDNIKYLKIYIEQLRAEGLGLPERNGKVNVTAVAAAVSLIAKRNIDRQTLYKNDGCRRLLEDAVRELGLRGMESRDEQSNNEKAALERQVTKLQELNMGLYAEVCELRERLRRYQDIDDMLIAQGRRVV
jgi:hypothetical protein